MNHDQLEFTREEFYDLIWKTSRLELAKRFNTTPAILTTLCNRATIPVPGPGYFRRLESGKKPLRTPLPNRVFGALSLIDFASRKPWTPPETVEDVQVPVVPEFSEPMESVFERARAEVAKQKIYKGLKPVHPSLQRALNHEAKQRDWMRSTTFGNRHRVLLNNLMWLLNSWATFDIRVGFNPIYLRLPSWSPEIHFEGKDESITVRVPGTTRGWTLPTSWSDSTKPLEGQLREIAATALAGAELYCRVQAEFARDCALELREDVRKRQLKKAAEREQQEVAKHETDIRNRRDRLLLHAANGARAEQIRTLVHRVLEGRSDSASPELVAWGAWALAEAEKLDPINLPQQHLIE